MAVLFSECAVSRADFEAMPDWDKALFVKLVEERARESGDRDGTFKRLTTGIRRADLMRARGFEGGAPAIGLRREDLYA